MEAEEDEKNRALVEKEAKENLDEDLNKEGAMGLGEQTEAVHDLNEMKERIQDLVNILSDFPPQARSLHQS